MKQQSLKQTLPPQHQSRQPGIESEMIPPPQSHAHAYTGSGKLDGKVALISGGDSGIGCRAWCCIRTVGKSSTGSVVLECRTYADAAIRFPPIPPSLHDAYTDVAHRVRARKGMKVVDDLASLGSAPRSGTGADPAERPALVGRNPDSPRRRLGALATVRQMPVPSGEVILARFFFWRRSRARNADPLSRRKVLRGGAAISLAGAKQPCEPHQAGRPHYLERSPDSAGDGSPDP